MRIWQKRETQSRPMGLGSWYVCYFCWMVSMYGYARSGEGHIAIVWFVVAFLWPLMLQRRVQNSDYMEGYNQAFTDLNAELKKNREAEDGD